MVNGLETKALVITPKKHVELKIFLSKIKIAKRYYQSGQ